jgi:hypothetical protein
MPNQSPFSNNAPAAPPARTTQRKVISKFSVQDPADIEDIESDDDDQLPIRENEIQRLVQFATESSIIEAVNLSNIHHVCHLLLYKFKGLLLYLK